MSSQPNEESDTNQMQGVAGRTEDGRVYVVTPKSMAVEGPRERRLRDRRSAAVGHRPRRGAGQGDADRQHDPATAGRGEVGAAGRREPGSGSRPSIRRRSASWTAGWAPELVEELDRLTLPFTDSATPTDAELRIAQAQLVGWLEGLFHGIQTALFAQQMAARAQLEQMRRALPAGPPVRVRRARRTMKAPAACTCSRRGLRPPGERPQAEARATRRHGDGARRLVREKAVRVGACGTRRPSVAVEIDTPGGMPNGTSRRPLRPTGALCYDDPQEILMPPPAPPPRAPPFRRAVPTPPAASGSPARLHPRDAGGRRKPAASATSTAAPCVTEAHLFQHPLLEEALPSSAPVSLRTLRASLTGRAERVCRGCPIWTDCLYAAVVEHDVAGFAAGTTAAQRVRIRRLLGIEVQPEDFDSLAGAGGRTAASTTTRCFGCGTPTRRKAWRRLLGGSVARCPRSSAISAGERASGSARVPAPPRPTVGAVLRATAEVTGAAAHRTRAA